MASKSNHTMVDLSVVIQSIERENGTLHIIANIDMGMGVHASGMTPQSTL